MKFGLFQMISFSISLIIMGFGSNAYSQNAVVNKLDVLTWNVWFDERSGVTRYPAIFDEVTTLSPQIVFLQEVTPKVIQAIQESKVNQDYHLTVSKDARRNYGQAFLTKSRLLMTEEYPLSSKYGRDALFGLYELSPTQAVILVNVHLESGLLESDSRQEQVSNISSELLPYFQKESQRFYPEKRIEHVIWSGDFNFGYTEFKSGIGSFIDVGRFFENNTPTYHVDNNKLANYTASLFEDSARLDRVFISKGAGLSALSYKVLNSDYYSTLSDHYPIHVTLEYKPGTKPGEK